MSAAAPLNAAAMSTRSCTSRVAGCMSALRGARGRTLGTIREHSRIEASCKPKTKHARLGCWAVLGTAEEEMGRKASLTFARGVEADDTRAHRVEQQEVRVEQQQGSAERRWRRAGRRRGRRHLADGLGARSGGGGRGEVRKLRRRHRERARRRHERLHRRQQQPASLHLVAGNPNLETPM